MSLRYKVKEALATLAIWAFVILFFSWPLILATIGVILWDWPWWAIFLGLIATPGWLITLCIAARLLE